jgi:hypothetical protein
LTETTPCISIKHGKEKRAPSAQKEREAGNSPNMDGGRVRSDRRPCRFNFRNRHPDNGDEARCAMTISRDKLLNFALGCFIFSTLVFAILFILK